MHGSRTPASPSSRLQRHRWTVLLAVLMIVLALGASLVSALIVQAQSAVRAYAVGESHWSKAQRDASFFLYRYGQTADPGYLRRFHEALELPKAHRAARLEMLSQDFSAEEAEYWLVKGKGHPDDARLAVLVFRCCSGRSDIQEIIGIWERGEKLLFELMDLSVALQAEVAAQFPSNMKLAAMLDRIEEINDEARPLQDAFVQALGRSARKVSSLLILFSAIVAFILAGVGTYVIRRAVHGIRESDNQYRVLLRSAGAGLIVTDQATGKVLEANRFAETLAERPAGALIGTAFQDLFASGESELQQLPGATTVPTRHLLGAWGAVTEVEVSIQSTLWQGRPARLAVIHDVSRRLLVERELRVARDAIANMSEAVVITDERFVVTSVNRAFSTISGHSAVEVIGRRHPALVGGEGLSTVRQVLREIRSEGRWQGQFEGRRKSGETYPRLASIAAVRDHGDKITHFVCIFTDHSAFRDYERQLRDLAENDVLTGLLNRASFTGQGGRMIEQARTSDKALALLFVDLDGFKCINDTHGHGAGDGVLKAVAARIREVAGPEALVARVGGDEFNLLFPCPRPTAEAGIALARRLLEAIAEPIGHEGRALSLSASVGVARFPLDAGDLSTLVSCADLAMYEAKARGRNNFQVHDPAATLPARTRQQLALDLRNAIELEQFQLHYQPQVELATGRIVGFEALLRWKHPDLGWVPPALFIPISEEMGVIDAVSDWVMRMACRQGVAWRDAGLGEIPISANLSPRNFWDRDQPARVAAILAETGWPASKLCLEITEGTLMAGDDPKLALRRIRDLGVTLAIDDFGVGYSSLVTLRQIPLDVLKIDRSFIAGIPGDGNNLALVSTILALANGLGLTVIAEGIETLEQRDALIGEGCLQAQGYLFGRPQPPEDCARLLAAGPIRVADATALTT